MRAVRPIGRSVEKVHEDRSELIVSRPVEVIERSVLGAEAS